jgi:hypothetical protein
VSLINQISVAANCLKDYNQTFRTYLTALLVRPDLEHDPVVVGVHVRRTDYVEWIQQRYNGTEIGRGFYERALESFR